MWNAATGKLNFVLKDKERRSAVSSVSFASSNDSKLALTIFNDSVAVWSVDNGEFMYSLAVAGGGIISLSCSGPWILTGSRDSHVRVWEMETGRLALVLSGHAESVTHVSISDNLRVAMSRANDGWWNSVTKATVSKS